MLKEAYPIARKFGYPYVIYLLLAVIVWGLQYSGLFQALSAAFYPVHRIPWLAASVIFLVPSLIQGTVAIANRRGHLNWTVGKELTKAGITSLGVFGLLTFLFYMHPDVPFQPHMVVTALILALIGFLGGAFWIVSRYIYVMRQNMKIADTLNELLITNTSKPDGTCDLNDPSGASLRLKYSDIVFFREEKGELFCYYHRNYKVMRKKLGGSIKEIHAKADHLFFMPLLEGALINIYHISQVVANPTYLGLHFPGISYLIPIKIVESKILKSRLVAVVTHTPISYA